MKGADNMTSNDLELTQAVVNYLEQAEQVRSAFTQKIASLEKEKESLRSASIPTETVKELVSKLASAGLIDQFNAAYFMKNASATNGSQCISRLVSLLSTGDASNKEASVPTPFKVEKPSEDVQVDKEEREYRKRLENLSRRA